MVDGTIASPFVGAHPFEEADRPRFFGRERDLRDLRRLLIAERIVLLYSPSGAGKTSLLRAGLAPALADDDFTVRPIMRVHSELPEEYGATSNRFLVSALTYLHKGLPQDQQDAMDPAAMGDITFSDYLDLIAGPDAGNINDVLIFDQFEEVLKIDPGSRSAHRARLDFFRQVGDALSSRRRWAVFSIREDYLAGLDPYRRLIPTRLTTHFRLDLLRIEGARRAISLPPLQASVTIADDAVDQLLSDLGGAANLGTESTALPGQIEDALYIEPLHLQIVCDRLWRDVKPAPGDEITRDRLGASYDVDDALRAFYDETVTDIAATSGSDERRIRDWFEEELIVGTEGIRGQVARGKHESGGLATATADALVQAKVVNRETRLKTDWYELSHDRLIPPVRASNAKWYEHNLSDFQHRARNWAQSGQPDHELLSPRDWLLASQESRREGVRLRDYEQRFLDESAASFKRNAMIAMAFVGLLLLSVVVFSIYREGEAQQRSRAWASQALRMLPGNEGETLDQALLSAVAAIDVAEGDDLPLESRHSLLQSLVFQPSFARPMAISNASPAAAPTLEATSIPSSGSMALSTDGEYSASLDAEGRVSIMQVPAQPQIDVPPDPVTMRTLPVAPATDAASETTEVTRLVFLERGSDDVGILVIGRENGMLEAWDIIAGRQIGEPFGPAVETEQAISGASHSVILTSLGAGPDGLIAAGMSNGDVVVWDVSAPDAPVVVTILESGTANRDVSAIAFQHQPSPGEPGGWQLLVGHVNGSFVAWESGTWESTQLPGLPSGDAVTSIAVHPEDGWLALGGAGGFIVQREVTTGRARPADISSTPQAGLDGELAPQRLQPIATPTPGGQAGPTVRTDLQATDGVTALAIDPAHHDILISAHDTGELRRWTIAPEGIGFGVIGSPVMLSEPTSEVITDLAFMPDGSWLVTKGAGEPVPALWNPDGLPPFGFALNTRESNLPTCPITVRYLTTGPGLLITGQDGTQIQWPTPSDDGTARSSPGGSLPTVAPSQPPAEEPTPGPLQCEQTARLIRPGGSGQGPIPVRDRSGNVWNANVTSVLGHDDALPVTATLRFSAISDDERMLATGYDNGLIRLWAYDGESWKHLGDLPGHRAAISSLSFAGHDDMHLASVSDDGLVIVWDLTIDRWVTYACVRAGTLFDATTFEGIPGLDEAEIERLERRHPCNRIFNGNPATPESGTSGFPFLATGRSQESRGQTT